MGSKVLAPLPAVPAKSGPRGLICAGHSIAPEVVPPGTVVIPCQRCGRPLVLGRTPPVQDTEPPTQAEPGAAAAVSPGAAAVAAAPPDARPSGARDSGDPGNDVEPTAERSTSAAPSDSATPPVASSRSSVPAVPGSPVLEETTSTVESSVPPPGRYVSQTCEMPAVNITAVDLQEIQPPPKRSVETKLPPPVKAEPRDPALPPPEEEEEPTVRFREDLPPANPRRTETR